MEKRAFLRIAAVLLAIAGGAWGKVIYVDDNAPPGGDGLSWATAYRYLQDGLAVAVEGDEVRVGQGLYKPDRSKGNPAGTRDRAATFEVGEGITLRGGFAGLGAEDPNAYDTSSYPCLLSGDLNGNDEPVSDPCDLMNAPSRLDNACHVVHLVNGTLDGVQITAGYAHRYVASSPDTMSFTTDHAGGGIWGEGTVRDCLVYGNYAEELGGGLWCTGRWNNEERPAISMQQCRFDGNAARFRGGGMCLMFCLADLSNCEIHANWAGWNGGGGDFYSSQTNAASCRFVGNQMSISGAGGGVSSRGLSFDQSHSKFLGCSWILNKANYGGAVFSMRGPCELDGCEIKQNSSDLGGALGAQSSSFVLRNTLVHGNRASEYGGAICIRQNVSLECQNCTLANNIAPEGSFLALGTNSSSPRDNSAVLSNCVLHNDGQELWNYDGDILIDHTNLVVRQDLWHDACNGIVLGEGNVETDPGFADPGYWDDNDTPDDPNDDVYVAGDYHLKSQAGRWDAASESWVQDDVTSPCIDAGDPNAPIMYEPFPNGGIINMGAYGGTPEASKSYFGDGVCETIIAGDINGDGKVDLTDLLLLIRHWTENTDEAPSGHGVLK